jgi:hypothetical protein
MGDAAAGTGEAHGGKADRRFSRARLADDAQDFAALQGDIDALDNGMPNVVALALDVQVADIEQGLALGARCRAPRNPLVLCRTNRRRN